MKKTILLFVTALIINWASGQNSLNAILKDSATQEHLTGASALLKGTINSALSNEKGELILTDIPDGEQTIIFNYKGYKTLEQKFTFPLTETKIIFLFREVNETETIIVEGTRSNRSIGNIPTRVEVLTEEIDEAATMDPSKVAHLLTHSTGIQVQQTSATSNTANVRIQGLDGRYTQILKDGFPLYGGFSGSLSIMQIPPLDLRQIEYIKGSASTLYGGGAIAGLINIISKEPSSNETIFHLNYSNIGALDINMFTAKKYDRIGFTMLAQRNSHRAFDADRDGFTDMPQLIKYNFNPKLVFYINPRSNLSVAGTFTTETRQGGDMNLLNNESISGTHFYKEQNNVNRITTQTKYDYRFDSYHTLTVKNSFNIFDRQLLIVPSFSEGNYRFAGKQLSSFSEVSFAVRKLRKVLITGINFYTDDFKETPLQNIMLRNESRQTLGAFMNYTFDIGKKISIESGIRGDYVLNDKFYVLPRLNMLFKWTDRLTTRIGGGMGYRNASIFNQEAELQGFKNILAINRNTTTAEKSYGGNADIGYKLPLGDNFFITFNQMFFYSYLSNPLILTTNGVYKEFINTNGYTQSRGGETFFKFGFHDFVFFVGYTYTDATNHFSTNIANVTLTPKHSLKGDLLYSLPGKWRIGVDYEFKSGQTLSNGSQSRSFWTYGAVVERYYRNFTFFGNIENIFDYRQTRYESLLSTPNYTPQFTEVWAPLDGRVLNTGIKIKF